MISQNSLAPLWKINKYCYACIFFFLRRLYIICTVYAISNKNQPQLCQQEQIVFPRGNSVQRIFQMCYMSLYKFKFEKIFKCNAFIMSHSSEIRSLCLMKCSSEMIQNLPQFWNMKTHVVSFIFYFVIYFIYFSPNKCPCICWHRLRYSFGKNKIAQN